MTGSLPPMKRWVLACTLGEALGMASVATAAGLLAVTVGEPSTAAGRVATVAVMATAGAVEGGCVAALQARALRHWFPALRTSRYIGGTVAVATAAWVLGMLPSVWPRGSSTAAEPVSTPPFAVMAAVVVAAGIAGGLLIGAAQAAALRGHVQRPWRWIFANVVGWTAAMGVIFTGAGTAPPGLPLPAVLGWGAATGLLAGAALGVGTGVHLHTLDDPRSLVTITGNGIVAAVLRSPAHRLLSGHITLVEYIGPRSGRPRRLPVAYVRRDDQVLAVVGRPERKTWWRAVNGRPVDLVLAGNRLTGVARVSATGDARHDELLSAYVRAVGRPTPCATPVVEVTLLPDHPAGGDRVERQTYEHGGGANHQPDGSACLHAEDGSPSLR